MSSSVISTASSRQSTRRSSRRDRSHSLSSSRHRSRSRSKSLLDMDHLISGIRELDQCVTSHGNSEKHESLSNLLDTTVSTTTASSSTSNSCMRVDDRYPRKSTKGVIQMNPQQEANWKKKMTRPNHVSSNKSVQSSASTAEIREKEIARTVLRMAMNEKNSVLFSDSDSTESKYASGVILGDLIRYEADDTRSVVSTLSLSSRRSTSRSRSKSRDGQMLRSNMSSKSHGIHSSQRSCTSDGVMGSMATDEADRLYNAFMKNLSPRPDLALQMNRARSGTASSVVSDHMVKKTNPSLSKATFGRSSSVPTTSKTVLPQVDGLDDLNEFDPFGLMKEKNTALDECPFSNVNSTSQSETDQNWGATVEGQNVRRYEFTFSEPEKSTNISLRKKKLDVRDGVSFNRSSSNGRKVQNVESTRTNDFKQKMTAEEIHPDALDQYLDISENTLPKQLSATTFVKKDPWEGFGRSEKFSSVPFHGDGLPMKTSPSGVAEDIMFQNEELNNDFDDVNDWDYSKTFLI